MLTYAINLAFNYNIHLLFKSYYRDPEAVLKALASTVTSVSYFISFTLRNFIFMTAERSFHNGEVLS